MKRNAKEDCESVQERKNLPGVAIGNFLNLPREKGKQSPREQIAAVMTK